ncbi:MAG: RNA polymerase sigma factor [Kordiimonas sp.]
MSLILKNFLQNEKALKKYLTRFFSRAQDIDDVAQETFLKAFASEAKSEIRAPKSFLFKVAKHTALNEIAKKSNSTTDYIEDSANSNVLEDEAQVGAEQIFDSKQKLIVFSKAVASLPPNCRRVFLLRKMEGLKVKEIARKLDISVSGVEKHIATGLVKCSQYFREQGYDPTEFGDIAATRKTKNDVTVSKLLRVRDE